MFAWLVRKAKRVAGRADAEVDRGLDGGMDQLHDLVSRKLGHDPALERAREEADAGLREPSERTRRRLADSLEDAVEQDTLFAQALAAVVKELQTARTAAGGDGLFASEHGHAIGGNVNIRAEGGSAAALTMGTVTIGGTANPPTPGSDQR
ncbi:hypothetical protein [Kitasatospora purpeofusca]|uniref:hypothetical protein n=1 Tax=Kitasatospora purpeofusca TaxID=67352 RepID=UPI0036D23C00